jgi:hypothetical protein
MKSPKKNAPLTFAYKRHEVDHDHEIGPNVLLHHSFTPGDYRQQQIVIHHGRV